MKTVKTIQVLCAECKNIIEGDVFIWTEDDIEIRVKPCKHCIGKYKDEIYDLEMEIADYEEQ